VLIVRSPVRISFAGGGTDLPAYYEEYGGAVLSASVNKYFYTILGKRNDGRVQVISSDLRVFETWHDISTMDIERSGLEIPLAVLKDLGCEISADLFLASEIPPGTGLGSSASVCVNMLKTLTSYLHMSLSKYDLAERAFHIARNVLGHHVGKQDEYAAAFGGLNFIEFHQDGSTRVQALELTSEVINELQASLMLFFTGSAHHSWSILEEQDKSTRAHAGVTLKALHEVKGFAEEMRAALERADMRSFGHLLNEAWQAKKRISAKISSPRIDQFYELAIKNGALGGKITGAGGGGFLLLFCEPAQQDRVREALLGEGIREMAFGFDFQGAQLIVNDPFIDSDEHAASPWIFVPSSRAC
jgi:D-glycero-alpha-D-manno-heptose-7-phosphate kinase